MRTSTVSNGSNFPHPRYRISSLFFAFVLHRLHIEQILLVGDSAGGNLSLGLLSALTHPREDMPVLPEISREPLAGTFLISPWVTYKRTSRSMSTNLYKDCLSPTALQTWGDAYVGGVDLDPYNCPLEASAGWWSEVKTKQITVIAGRDEIFCSDIESFVQMLEVCATSLSGVGRAIDVVLTVILGGQPVTRFSLYGRGSPRCDLHERCTSTPHSGILPHSRQLDARADCERLKYASPPLHGCSIFASRKSARDERGRLSK